VVNIQDRVTRVTNHIFVIIKNVQIDYVLIVRFFGIKLLDDSILVQVIDVLLTVNTTVSFFHEAKLNIACYELKWDNAYEKSSFFNSLPISGLTTCTFTGHLSTFSFVIGNFCWRAII
jgi:hypothetical protein